MRADNPRWVEVTPSQFPHERRELDRIKLLLPDPEPYHAWSNFEIITDRGRALEVDLMVLTASGLYIVELKCWGGTLTGDRYLWRLRSRGRPQPKDNPWILANRKAKEIRSAMVDRLRRLEHPPANPDAVLPWIEAVVDVHHPDIRCELPAVERPHLYGLDEATSITGLPGIVRDLLARPPADPSRAVTPSRARAIAALINQAGFGRRRRRRIGGYVLRPDVFAEGLGYQDFLAEHATFADEVVRVRVWNTGTATTAEERGVLERAAQREYRLLRHLQYPGIVTPIAYHDSDLGPALIYGHDEPAQRLDHLIATEQLDLDAQLAIVRGVAETLQFAHGRKITHRGLSPRAVCLRHIGSDGQSHWTAQVADWQAGAMRTASGSGESGEASSLVRGTTDIRGLLDRAEKAYAAPETRLGDRIDGVRADVFSLGAIAYHILTGQPPAADGVELGRRVADDQGLDLAVHLDSPPEPLRQLVLESTRGSVGDRLASVDEFIDKLSLAEDSLRRRTEGELVDPLEAPPGTILVGRWRLVQRLGSGSTAVGLLVREATGSGAGPLVVLKVAKDDDRASRLREEADVLRSLTDPRVARLVQEPFPLGHRVAMAVEYAGDKTLARLLQEQPGRRLSLDRLERFGHDLIDTVAYLHVQGVDHRDIKPDNLGVHARSGDGEVHLKLFDFSLSRVSDRSLDAGTRPYLDPFLGQPGRRRFDDQAEWYAVAVTLFEMATGGHPIFGDGQSDPQQVADEATVEPGMFDAAIAEPLAAFFRRALRRDARRRYPTIEAMRDAWSSALRGAGTAVRPGATGTHTDDPDALAAAATLATLLDRSGLSARALSAVERLNVTTVGDLLAVPAVALSRLAGTNEATRRELRARTKAWRERLSPAPRPVNTEVVERLRAVDLVVEQLVPGSNGRNANEIDAARLLLGQSLPPTTEGGRARTPEGWLTQTRLAKLLGVTQPTANNLDRRLREAWKNDPTLREVRDDLVALIDAHGGVATVTELAAGLLVTRGSAAPAGERERQGIGLVRVAVETELDHGGRARLARGQRDGIWLVAGEPSPDDPGGPPGQALLNYARALGRAATRLVAAADAPTSLLRAAQELRRVTTPPGLTPLPDTRLVRLAAHASQRAAVSSRDELYARRLPALQALRYSSAAYGSTGALRVNQLRERVALRFPEAARLPGRPELDELLREIGSPLEWVAAEQVYRARTAPSVGSGSRGVTTVAGTVAVSEFADCDDRVRDALKSAAYLVVTTPRAEYGAAAQVLTVRYGLRLVNVTADLLARMHRLVDERGGPSWAQVLAADAAPPDSYPGRGLRGLVTQAVAGLSTDIDTTAEHILLADAAPLARYGHVGILERQADHTTRRRHALLVLVPEPDNAPVPMLDRTPVPLVGRAQWLRLPDGWIRHAAGQDDAPHERPPAVERTG